MIPQRKRILVFVSGSLLTAIILFSIINVNLTGYSSAIKVAKGADLIWE